jgi:hypothetical protein
LQCKMFNFHVRSMRAETITTSHNRGAVAARPALPVTSKSASGTWSCCNPALGHCANLLPGGRARCPDRATSCLAGRIRRGEDTAPYL